MSKKLMGCLVLYLTIYSLSVWGKTNRYAEQYCKRSDFHCITVQKGDKWKTLWPNETQRHLVMKLNRMNSGLITGMSIAVPDDLKKTTLMDIAPFSSTVTPTGEKWIQIKLSDLAWGAYDADGKLVKWGAASGGKDWCPDIQAKCTTVTGSFKVERKGSAKCKSNTFPLPDGGAPMPYCMFFHRGYAIHGSNDVPGYNASHGCVRVWVDDAKWLSQEFLDIGTTVVVH